MSTLTKISGFSKYFADTSGNIYSNVTGTMRKLDASYRNGYLRVHIISDDGSYKRKNVHELILLAFVGPAPSGELEVCHWDGDKANNKLENLRWDTPTSNGQDKIRHGHTNRGVKSPSHKITEQEARAIKSEYIRHFKKNNKNNWRSNGLELANKYGVHKTHITRIVNGSKWSWL